MPMGKRQYWKVPESVMILKKELLKEYEGIYKNRTQEYLKDLDEEEGDNCEFPRHEFVADEDAAPADPKKRKVAPPEDVSSAAKAKKEIEDRGNESMYCMRYTLLYYLLILTPPSQLNPEDFNNEFEIISRFIDDEWPEVA